MLPGFFCVILLHFILRVVTRLIGSIGKQPFFPLLSSTVARPSCHKMLFQQIPPWVDGAPHAGHLILGPDFMEVMANHLSQVA